MMATDRRTAGTQVEDQSIELKAATRIQETVGDRGHINATSYNRYGAAHRRGGQRGRQRRRRAGRVTHRERASVVNELAVMPNSSLTSRSNDAI